MYGLRLIAIDGFSHDILALCAEMDEQGRGHSPSFRDSSFSKTARQIRAESMVTGLNPLSKQVAYMVGS